eukprot:1195576-Prorocentrum_minimum.AAC.18
MSLPRPQIPLPRPQVSLLSPQPSPLQPDMSCPPGRVTAGGQRPSAITECRGTVALPGSRPVHLYS